MSAPATARHKDAWKHELRACFERFFNERWTDTEPMVRFHAYTLFMAELLRQAASDFPEPAYRDSQHLANIAAHFAIVFDGQGKIRPAYQEADEELPDRTSTEPKGGVQ